MRALFSVSLKVLVFVFGDMGCIAIMLGVGCRCYLGELGGVVQCRGLYDARRRLCCYFLSPCKSDSYFNIGMRLTGD